MILQIFDFSRHLVGDGATISVEVDLTDDINAANVWPDTPAAIVALGVSNVGDLTVAGSLHGKRIVLTFSRAFTGEEGSAAISITLGF